MGPLLRARQPGPHLGAPVVGDEVLNLAESLTHHRDRSQDAFSVVPQFLSTIIVAAPAYIAQAKASQKKFLRPLTSLKRRMPHAKFTSPGPIVTIGKDTTMESRLLAWNQQICRGRRGWGAFLYMASREEEQGRHVCLHHCARVTGAGAVRPNPSTDAPWRAPTRCPRQKRAAAPAPPRVAAPAAQCSTQHTVRHLWP